MKITFVEKVQIALIVLFPVLVYFTGKDIKSVNEGTVFLATFFSLLVGFATYAVTTIMIITRNERQKTNWKQKVFLSIYGIFFLSIMPYFVWQIWHYGVDKEFASTHFFFITMGTAPWIQVLLTDLRYQMAPPLPVISKDTKRSSVHPKIGLN